ncbi:MAG: EI24 domain-containing protein [Lentisphaeria bacterium]|nr:EI24 domain-containing protein [Lentisphaeria bacterium]
MKKALDELAYGVDCAFRGIRIFFTRPRLWPYALPPLLLVLLLYAGILFALIFWAAPGFREWLAGISFPGWLSWLQTTLDWCLKLFFWIVIPLVLFYFIGTFYEMFGNMLFDILVDAFEKEDYPEHPGAVQPYSRVLRLTSGFILLTVVSYLVYFMLFWIPVVGFLFRGAICGRSYLHDSSVRQGLPVSVLKKQVAKNRLSVLGFGIVARFAESIPFLIPGLVIGGSILYHTRLLKDTPPKERAGLNA